MDLSAYAWTMDLRDRRLTVDEMATPARVETRKTYQDAITEFESRNYTYMPLPDTDEYYNTAEGWFGDLRAEQRIPPDIPLREALELLCDNPFLLVEYTGEESDDGGSDDGAPNGRRTDESGTDGKDEEGRADPDSAEGRADPDSDYGIVTVSDVNRRPTHELIYPVIAELATLFADRIESRYESRELLQRLDDRTVGAWVKDEQRDVELHVAESMDLGEMQRVLRTSPPELAKSCGFHSKDELDDFGPIRDLRNRVMHANRSLVRDREDLREMLDTIDRALELLADANTGAPFE